MTTRRKSHPQLYSVCIDLGLRGRTALEKLEISKEHLHWVVDSNHQTS